MDHAGPLLFHSNDHLLPSRVSLRDRAAPDAEKDQSETACDAGGCRHTVRIIDKGGDEQRRAERNQQEAQRPRDLSGGERDHGERKRSEEHTSELQSLMRISYAVFCLKKKNKHTPTTKYNTS